MHPSPIRKRLQQQIVRQSSHMISTEFKSDSILKDELLLQSVVEESGTEEIAEESGSELPAMPAANLEGETTVNIFEIYSRLKV